MSEIIFELKDVHYSYLGKFPALCGVDMTVRKGEKIAVIGANGTGKSTLLHLLDGLIFPDKGQLKAFGALLTEDFINDPGPSRNFRSKVGLVFQNADIQLFCPTVREDIVFGPLQLGMTCDEARKRLSAIAQLLDIEHLLDRVPYQLSVGEKRKVAIATVFAIDPDVLILDEPIAGLDPLTVRHIIDLIIQANQKGKTVITSTHDLHTVGEIADTVYVFNKEKRIVRQGKPREVLSDRAFLEAHNLVHVHGHYHDNNLHVHPHLSLEKHDH
jgi:cobalt/nickel transport system ATP-binding protein